MDEMDDGGLSPRFACVMQIVFFTFSLVVSRTEAGTLLIGNLKNSNSTDRSPQEYTERHPHTRKCPAQKFIH